MLSVHQLNRALHTKLYKTNAAVPGMCGLNKRLGQCKHPPRAY